jgi:hypothetical protein
VRETSVLTSVVRDRPGWNWGAVTGTPSGIWVLDVDPDNGGMESLAGLVAVCGTSAYLGAHRVHRTGSGGLHLIYAIGDDGWMPRTGAGKIGPGLDVRAEGGQIVLPGSVSGKGTYTVERDLGLQVVGAMLRGEIERRLAPAPREPREVGPASAGEQGAVTEGGERYARAVLEACLVEMRDAPVGTRNDTGFRTAVRIWELVLAPWCSLAEEDVLDDWWAAAGITGAPATELQGLWTRAYGRAVEGDGAVLPASTVGGDDVPFVGTGVAPVAVVDTSVMTVLEYREYQEAAGEAPVTAPSLRPKLLVRSAVGGLPKPRWLIQGVLDFASDAWLIGASGSYKSFVALDWACHVASGKPWRGRQVRQGKVLYVVAEGLSGIPKRLDAWEEARGTTVPDDFMVLPEAVYATLDPRAKPAERMSAMWRELVEMTGVDRPALIVLDTQARMTIGLNENDNADMGFWADCVAGLKAASGACVLVVHHTGRKGGDARGGSAIDAAQDVEWTVSRTDQRTAKLIMTKSKDAEDRVEHALEFDVVELGEDEDGNKITSLAVRDGDAVAAVGTVMVGGLVTDSEPVRMSERDVRALLMYRAVLETVPDVGATEAEIRALFRGLPAVARLTGPAQRKAAARAWNDLVALGLVMQQDGRARYRVVVLASQGDRGALTPNPVSAGWMAPDGWSVVRASYDAE